MRALLVSSFALGGCAQVLGIDDFETPPPGIEGRLGVRLNNNRPQTEADIAALDSVNVQWENPNGVPLSTAEVQGGYYQVPMDELSGGEREGSLHFELLAQSLDVYVDLRRRIEFGQTIDVVVPDAALRPPGIVIAALARDRFGDPVAGLGVELRDENDATLPVAPLYLDDEQVPDATRAFTGNFGIAWFSGAEIVAGRSYQVHAQAGQTEFTSRVIVPADGSFHFLAAEAED